MYSYKAVCVGSGLHDAIVKGGEQLGRILELAHLAIHQLHEGILQRALEQSVTLTARQTSKRQR